VIEISSYRRVFELERRIYRIDRLRLNPTGIPVRGVVYFVVLVAASVLAGAAPLLAALARTLPWYLRTLILPGIGAALFALIRIEGRPFHLAARSLIGYRLSPRQATTIARNTAARTRWSPREIVLLPDGSDARIRRLRYAGPGAVLVTVEHERAVARAGRVRAALARRHAGAELAVREAPEGRPLERGTVVVVASGARIVTECPAGPVPKGWRTPELTIG
jgi:hypothetical protein